MTRPQSPTDVRPTIAVVGSINVDQVIQLPRHPRPGETLLGTSITHTSGGKGANQAVAASLAGAAVRLIGAVGSDGYDDVALHYLRASGVDVSSLDNVDGSTGLAAIQVSDDGENSIVVLPGANGAVDAECVRRHAEQITAADAVLLQGEIPANGICEAIRVATDNGVRVIVNLAPVIPIDPQALLHANPLIANQHEAQQILRMHGVDENATDYSRIAALLCEVGYKSVVITLGADGALVAQGATPQTTSVGSGPVSELIPSPRVNAVDTTGAGDAFAGALTARLAGGKTLTDAARFAVRFAAATVQKPGAQSSYPLPGDELPN